jgi:DeoR/GlpR family transcriptional regulator of sugar metabolism
MLKEERHLYIQNKIRSEGKVLLTEICQEMSVSDDTIRRDLQELEKEGILTKVHGGAIANQAILPSAAQSADDFSSIQQSPHDKEALVMKASELLEDGDTLLMSGDALTVTMVKNLPRTIRLTVFTNSLTVAMALADKPLIQTVMLGGNVLPETQMTVGTALMKSLHSMEAKWLVTGNVHIDPQTGLTVSSREEALLLKEMRRRTKQWLVIAEPDKLNTAANQPVGSLGDVSILVVPDFVLEAVRGEFTSEGLQIP